MAFKKKALAIRKKFTVSPSMRPMNGNWPIHMVEFEDLVASNFEGYVTNFAPHPALKLIA